MIRKLLLIITLCIPNIGCSDKTTDMPTKGSSEHNESATSSSQQEFTLDKYAFENNKKLAESGDLIAARKLYEHYVVGLNDITRALPWMEIIAKSGDVRAQRTLAFNYMTLGGADYCLKFRYWASNILDGQDHKSNSKLSEDTKSMLDDEYKNCLEGKKWWGKELENSIEARIKNSQRV